MLEITSSKRLLLSMQTIQLIQDQTTNQNHYQNYQESLKKQKRRPLAPEINTNHQYHNDGKGDKASLGRKLTGEYTRRTTYRLFQTVCIAKLKMLHYNSFHVSYFFQVTV